MVIKWWYSKSVVFSALISWHFTVRKVFFPDLLIYFHMDSCIPLLANGLMLLSFIFMFKLPQIWPVMATDSMSF